jgi:hypothetical protein
MASKGLTPVLDVATGETKKRGPNRRWTVVAISDDQQARMDPVAKVVHVPTTDNPEAAYTRAHETCHAVYTDRTTTIGEHARRVGVCVQTAQVAEDARIQWLAERRGGGLAAFREYAVAPAVIATYQDLIRESRISPREVAEFTLSRAFTGCHGDLVEAFRAAAAASDNPDAYGRAIKAAQAARNAIAGLDPMASKHDGMSDGIRLAGILDKVLGAIREDNPPQPEPQPGPTPQPQDDGLERDEIDDGDQPEPEPQTGPGEPGDEERDEDDEDGDSGDAADDQDDEDERFTDDGYCDAVDDPYADDEDEGADLDDPTDTDDADDEDDDDLDDGCDDADDPDGGWDDETTDEDACDEPGDADDAEADDGDDGDDGDATDEDLDLDHEHRDAEERSDNEVDEDLDLDDDEDTGDDASDEDDDDLDLVDMLHDQDHQNLCDATDEDDYAGDGSGPDAWRDGLDTTAQELLEMARRTVYTENKRRRAYRKVRAPYGAGDTTGRYFAWDESRSVEVPAKDREHAVTLARDIQASNEAGGMKRIRANQPEYNPFWGPMIIHRPILEQAAKGSWKRPVKAYGDTGCVPNAIQRFCTDQRIFAVEDRRMSAPTILVDLSGSMSLSVEQVQALVEEYPYCTIATYSGRDSWGALRIIAGGGKYTTRNCWLQPPSGSGNNTVDAPALRWLARQGAPRVWVSDGYVTTPRWSTDYRADATVMKAALDGEINVASLRPYVEASRLCKDHFIKQVAHPALVSTYMEECRRTGRAFVADAKALAMTVVITKARYGGNEKHGAGSGRMLDGQDYRTDKRVTLDKTDE